MSKMKNARPDVVSGEKFSETLAGLERGELDYDMTHLLNEVVRKVREHGSKGMISLKLTVKPCDRDASQVEVMAEIDSKCPKAQRKKGLRFTSPDGRLLMHDPNQMEFQDGGFDHE
jgi:hypothetical protein